MAEHRGWVACAVLGVGYVVFGVVLALQAATGSFELRWSVVFPGLLLLVGLVVAGTGLVSWRLTRPPAR